MKEPVGLIGIGLVGSALAEGLLRRGYPVVGYDLQASQRVALEQLGGEAAACSAQVGQRVERLLLSLMDTEGDGEDAGTEENES